MISSEVQRTLVKSPPELWTEISDPESLARHLGEFGEIRITRVQPEQKVEWEADDASGTVVIKPSGWGTKVKLTVTREHPQPEQPPTEGPVAVDDEPEHEQPSVHTPDLAAGEPAIDIAPESDAADPALMHNPQAVAEPDSELEPASEPRPQVEATEKTEPHEEAEAPIAQPEPEPRRGIFARLFGRRRPRTEELSPDEIAEPAAQPIASEPIDDEPLLAGTDVPERELEAVDELEHEPAPSVAADEPAETDAQPLGALTPETGKPAAEQTTETPANWADASEQRMAPDDASARAKLAEELAAEEVTAVLTGVLDRLGAAHHRPFSRA